MTRPPAATSIPRHPLALRPVLGAALTLALVLAVLSPRYGYHRDELYFRMLPPAWGYVDQPPLMPPLTQGAALVLGDSVIAPRIVALLIAATSIVLLALVTREVGGDARAQALTAWGMAGATMTLMFGHVLLTATLDLVVWPATLLFAIRAVRRDEGRWWLAAGAVVGVSTYNKLLIVVLMAGIAVGLAVMGPRGWFRSGWLWGGVAVAGLFAVPNAVYQATHGWPQLAMGAALGENNADEVRILMWPMLILLVGPVLSVCWLLALRALLRRPEWRDVRFLAVTFAVVVVFVFAAGAQFYYTAGVLAVLTALGGVVVAEWAATRRRRRILAAGLALNAVLCAVASVPVLPERVLGATGIGALNSAVGDQVGWERYVAQVTDAVASTAPDVVFTTNYGEAGALDRFGDGLPPVVSGHNALSDLTRPPADAERVLVVGRQGPWVAAWFERCEIVGALDNGVGVDNEEQGVPLTLCDGPTAPWDEIWADVRHLD